MDEWDGPETDEILRKAGSRLMEAPVFAGGGVGGLYMLFDSCNYIASLTYGTAASFGEMLIARSGHGEHSADPYVGEADRIETASGDPQTSGDQPVR